jgi:hypothetical protein
MQFSDNSGSQGIVEEVNFLVNTNASTYPIADKTRNINRWLDVVVSDILQSSNRWQWDDVNFTTTPRATTDLVSGQKQYSFDSNWLEVERIDIKDQNSNWVSLLPIDEKDIPGGYDAFYSTNGTPECFDVDGENFYLFPAPNYNSDEGMKVWFRRKPDYFTVADTTQEPGFAAPFHRILSWGAAYDYALSHEMPQASALRLEIERMRKDLKEYYANRNKYERPQIKAVRRNGDYQ